MLETLFYPDEVRASDVDLEGAQVSERELDMAFTLIELLRKPFEPEEYHDHYREALAQLIDAKLEGREVVKSPAGARDQGDRPGRRAAPERRGGAEGRQGEARGQGARPPADPPAAADPQGELSVPGGGIVRASDAEGHGHRVPWSRAVRGPGVHGDQATGPRPTPARCSTSSPRPDEVRRCAWTATSCPSPASTSRSGPASAAGGAPPSATCCAI